MAIVRLIGLAVVMIGLGTFIGYAVVELSYWSVEESFADQFYEKYPLSVESKKDEAEISGLVELSDDTEVLFGACDTNRIYQRSFEIHNSREEALELTVDHFSEDCWSKDIDVSKPVTVEPGARFTLTLSWVVREIDVGFTRSVSLKTNDKEKPNIEFSLTGNSKDGLVAEPIEYAVNESTDQNQKVSAEFKLISYQHEKFNVTSHKILNPNFEANLEFNSAVLDKSALAEFTGAKSGYLLKVDFPDGLPAGSVDLVLEVNTDLQDFAPVKFVIKRTPKP